MIKLSSLSVRVGLFIGLLFAIAAGPSPAIALSDDEIRQQIIAQSIASYPGRCPCPFNRASNGSRCGKRSAYTRPGGYSPLCYQGDVSDKMVADYRRRHGLEMPANGDSSSAPAPVDIFAAQRQLLRLGYEPGPVDGSLGPKTRSALKAFQGANGLPASGDLTSETLKRLGIGN